MQRDGTRGRTEREEVRKRKLAYCVGPRKKETKYRPRGGERGRFVSSVGGKGQQEWTAIGRKREM